ncbi:MAG: hypothetical protein M1821_002900 [Bathelium mastoideum]|nr:MAG: hypothetical protein M1821_002900 [Bathelium mastoideum]KAI9694457.1 MAG: hypothetical protein M1822_000073 [Bathelium mastoideum]
MSASEPPPSPPPSDPSMAEASQTSHPDPAPFEDASAQARLAHPDSAQATVLRKDPVLAQLAQADPANAPELAHPDSVSSAALKKDPVPAQLAQADAADAPALAHPASLPEPQSTHAIPHTVTHTDPVQVQDAATQAVTTIEPGSEEDSSSSDAGYGTDDSSSTSTSLSSSVRDYAFENGRRYHKFRQGNYAFPNDDQEQHREDMKHAMALAASGDRLHFAPLGPDPQHVIDLGTGTGIWAVEMGDTYPSAQVLGIDLSPIQPTWVPPNVRFMVDDAESDWLYPPDHFDLVHARHCMTAFKDWARLLVSARTHLRPGGWVEVQDIHYFSRCDDGTMPEGYMLQKWLKLVHEGLETMGVNLAGAPELTERIRAAGFQSVDVRVVKLPIGRWPRNPLLKKVGLYLQAVITDGLEGISLKPLCHGLGWTKEEVEVLLAGVRKDLKNSAIHSYFNMYTAYGQKPIVGW